jgi:hypothetical protein
MGYTENTWFPHWLGQLMEPQGEANSHESFLQWCLDGSVLPKGAAKKYHYRAAAVVAKAPRGNPGGLRAPRFYQNGDLGTGDHPTKTVR